MIPGYVIWPLVLVAVFCKKKKKNTKSSKSLISANMAEIPNFTSFKKKKKMVEVEVEIEDEEDNPLTYMD